MIEKKIKNWKIIFSLFPALILGGCISLFPSPGPLPKYHDLVIQTINKPIRSTRMLVIETPSAPLMLNSKDIIIQKQTATGETYFTILKHHQWEEELPKMVQRDLVQYLRSPRWPSVFMENGGAKSGLILKTDITSFNIIAPNQVHIKLFLTLLDAESRKVISAEEFNSTISTPSTVTGFMNGFNQAASDLFAQVYKWVEKKVH